MKFTIARECGCYGDEVGQVLADRLNVPLYNKKTLTELAKKKGILEHYPDYFGENPAVTARGAEGLVCGLPKNMDGTEGSRANKSRRFAQRLANTAGVPVVMWDERRTTVSAAAILADNDTFGAKRKERLDSVSAAVILESFLNWRAHHPGEEPPELVRPEQ